MYRENPSASRCRAPTALLGALKGGGKVAMATRWVPDEGFRHAASVRPPGNRPSSARDESAVENLTEAAEKPSALCMRTCASVPVRVDWRGCGPGSLRVMTACVERDSGALSRGERRSLLPPVPAALCDLVFLCVSPFPILEGGPNGCISYFCAIVLFLHPQKRCPVTGRALSEVCPDNEPISETPTSVPPTIWLVRLFLWVGLGSDDGLVVTDEVVEFVMKPQNWT